LAVRTDGIPLSSFAFSATSGAGLAFSFAEENMLKFLVGHDGEKGESMLAFA
jgi:hypothetical protein